MFGRGNFRDCITDNLKGKGYGKKRTDEVLQIFERKVKEYDRAGMRHPDADMKAMAETFSEVAYQFNEKRKRINHNFHVLARTRAQILKGQNVSVSSLAGDRGAGLFGGSKGVGMARGVAAQIAGDPRFSTVDYITSHHAYAGKYFALLGDALDNFSKGTFGMQRGLEHMGALVDELYGASSGNPVAKAFADAYKKVQRVMVEDFNRAGGSMRYLDTFYMPQKQTVARLLKAGQGAWVKDHMDWLDWDKMTWPNGDLIEPADRLKVLEEVYFTLSTGGANKIKDNALHGHGAAVGNQLENDRFMIFKSGKAWSDMHAKYGDGNAYEVVSEHIIRSAAQVAQVETFGTSPSMWISTAKAVGLREVARLQKQMMDAGDNSEKVKTMKVDFESAMRRVEDMFTAALHQNSMDPHSRLGAINTTSSNLLMAAQLGGAVIPAVGGDLFTKTAVKVLNGSGFSIGLGAYLKGMAPGGYGKLDRMLARAGFVADETVSSAYIAERFTGLNTYAAPISRRVGDTVLRATGLNRHTNVARGTAKLEQMGLFVEYSDTAFGELPFRPVLERYGINEADWNAIRKLPHTSPDGGSATFITPMSVLETDLPNKHELYRKMYAFVDQEARYFVPASTLEATVVAKGVTRPDTMAGLVLHSFAMYKNFPLTFAMQYGRLALAQPDKMTRIGFLASLGLGMTLVGAAATQVKELAKGRTPMDMNDPRFWGKAFLAGGAAGIWGDFLFSSSTEYGKGPAAIAAGPLVGLYGDMANLAFGTSFKWVDQADKGEAFNANVGARSVEFAKRYAPGSSIWWARLALEREMWDRLQYMADPKAREKWRRKVKRQKEEVGNAYWLQPGERILGD